MDLPALHLNEKVFVYTAFVMHIGIKSMGGVWTNSKNTFK